MITKQSKLFKQLVAIILTCVILFGVNPLQPFSAANRIMNDSNKSALKVDPKANTVEGFKATGAILYDTIKASMKIEEQKAVQNKNTDVIDVTKYGVIGDGVTQNADAFMAALSAAMSSGKALYFPDGVYDLAGYSNIVEASNNLTIIGQSRTNTRIINSPRINVRENLRIENISLSTKEAVVFWMMPKNFHTLYANNVNFSGDSSKTIIFYTSVENTLKGLNRIDITNCEVSNCKDFVRLYCYIESGLIEKNIIKELGVRGKALSVIGIMLGYQDNNNVTTAPATNILIKDNYMKGFYNQIQNEVSPYYMRGMLIYGNDITIDGNYLEDIMGGRAHEGIYTKGARSKILNNTLYNAGDGQGSIVHKSYQSLSPDKVIIKGNRIISDICSQDSIIHAGIVVESNRFDVIDNYVNMNHGMGLGMSSFGDKPGTAIEEANVIGNEVCTYGRNALQIQAINGKITIQDNNFTYVPNYEPIISGSGIISHTEAAVTVKIISLGSQLDISNNTITSVEKSALFMFAIEDGIPAVIEKNIINVTEGARAFSLPQELKYELIDNVTNRILDSDVPNIGQRQKDPKVSSGGSSNSSVGEKTSTNTGTNSLAWKQDNIGWWLERQDGSYPVSQWIQKDGLWYYFDASGYMATGWQEINSIWYYLSNSGNMESNDWVYSNNYWYFLSEDGSMKVGWQEWKGSWYYLNSPNGEMAVNMVTPDGYAVDNNGVWIP